MNSENLKFYKELSLKEKRTYFSIFFGLHCFFKEIVISKISKAAYIKEKNDYDELSTGRYYFRYKVESGDTPYSFVAFNSTKNEIGLMSRETNEIVKIRLEEFESPLSENVITLLISCAKNDFSKSNKSLIFKAIEEFKNSVNDFPFRFVLGAGVSNSHDYNGPSWKDLEDRFEERIEKKYGIADAKKIADSVFNINYGVFQIIKDIDYSEYEDEIFNLITSLKEPDIDDDTTLASVVRIIHTQFVNDPYSKQSLLTFNYDDLFEQLFAKIDGGPYSLEWKKDYKILGKLKFVIKHPHGYVNKSDIEGNRKNLDGYIKSIVLTNEEYIDAYTSSKSIGYKLLYDQLEKTCHFVGNSITDYEEQKVLKIHFKKNPSSFHYAFFAKENIDGAAAIYKTFFLLKIGVIPLWFETNVEIKNFLNKFAPLF